MNDVGVSTRKPDPVARAREMAAAIKTETNGRFDLQVFPNSQLGSDTDMLSQVRSGGVEFFTLSGLILATLVPAASINGMAAPGTSSCDIRAILQRLAEQQLPQAMTYEWTDMSYLELLAGDTATARVLNVTGARPGGQLRHF